MKNQKTKYYLKYNLIGLLIGGIFFGSLGVYAALTFPSNNVSFDPSNSTLISTNVQDAIDELYNVCKTPVEPPTIPVDQIIENASLEKDEYECRYFFTGANPNNYVTFNGDVAAWRIISVECDGRIKIMRIVSIEERKWSSTNSNSWSRPSTLNAYLNGSYYNSLNSTAKNQIAVSDFSIGAVKHVNNYDLSTQVSNENASKWKGNIALPTVSEYIRTNSNKSSCGTLSLNNDNYSSCESSGWMDNWMGIYESWWTLTPPSDVYSGAALISYIDRYGEIDVAGTSQYLYSALPTLYLSSEVQIKGGTGTQDDPYVIS